MAHFLLRLFVKNADQTSDPKVRAAVGTLSGIVGILCNFFLFLGKVIIGTLSGSVSITADAMNNLSDAASSIVTLVGFKLAEQPADAEHPYGHARFEYLSGLVVSAMIVIIGFELAKTSVGKILSPVPDGVFRPAGGGAGAVHRRQAVAVPVQPDAGQENQLHHFARNLRGQPQRHHHHRRRPAGRRHRGRFRAVH